MKKCLAALMLATMLLATGCGNNAMDGAKKDAQEAAQKVEQKVEEAKSDAAAKVDEAKAKADEAKDAATAKVDEAKSDAAAKVEEAKSDAKAAMDNAAAKVDSMVGKKIAFGDVKPGVTFDEAKVILGEPVSVIEDDKYYFDNGLLVEINDKSIVDEISSREAGVATADGVEVGMMDYALNEHCGPADAIEQNDDGEVEYKYFSGDKKSQLIYKTRNGLITEIICSLNG